LPETKGDHLIDTVTTTDGPDIIVEFVLIGLLQHHYWEIWVRPDASVEVFFENGRSDVWPSYGELLRYLRSQATIIEVF
jgi:hypothetical protein